MATLAAFRTAGSSLVSFCSLRKVTKLALPRRERVYVGRLTVACLKDGAERGGSAHRRFLGGIGTFSCECRLKQR